MYNLDVLLVEDNPADAKMILEAFKDRNLIRGVQHVRDGEEAMSFLRRKGRYANSRRPDIILLDLNLPKKDGREVLSDIKSDAKLKVIPVVVVSTSQAEEDIRATYELHGNCYITKPSVLAEFEQMMSTIENFWMRTASLPPKGTDA